MTTGPFETETQAIALPAVRAIYAAFAAAPRVGGMDEPCRQLLAGSLEAAGVSLGAYDRRVLAWLAGWEPQIIAVIAAWITRARHPGQASPGVTLTREQAGIVLAALEDAAGWRETRATSTCQDCAESPVELCDDHATDLDLAGAYRELARRLAATSPAPAGQPAGGQR
jgi:hypothetical protein